MDRSEGVNVAVGAVLVGFGAVILGLIAPEAAYVASALCIAAGGYLVIGVYMGWPLPTTAAERAFRPNLTVELTGLRDSGDDFVVFHVAIKNHGRGDANDAFVNVVVPDFVTEMARCTAEGETGLEEHKGAFSREAEQFWNGNVSFPGRRTRFVFFRVTLPDQRGFPVRLNVTSPELNTPLEHRFELPAPGSAATPRVPGTGGQES